ncbi:MBF1 domain-containing protein [Rhizoctonia solani AG-1 IA]|uniref:MBF1 domain-containing protein n=1 Tax=Thanatephorus cucumeris (strain AG1-IA) TaxID=983506 RepID=L8WUD6_THACA|nr:MBF1 domain-containing protein [Rhizoctonia solani AG-1 IA]
MDFPKEIPATPENTSAMNQSRTGPSDVAIDANQATDPAMTHAPFKLWNPPTEIVPDLEDLEPTAAEIVAAYQAQARKSENLRNAPLLTQEIRDRQQREKYKKWPNLNLTMPSDQPPARELKVSDATVRDKTLLDLQLAPSSVLLLRFLSDELNGREKNPPLHPTILATAKDFPIVADLPQPQPDDRPELTKSTTAGMNNKETENKLARLLKLQSQGPLQCSVASGTQQHHQEKSDWSRANPTFFLPSHISVFHPPRHSPKLTIMSDADWDTKVVIGNKARTPKVTKGNAEVNAARRAGAIVS